VLAQRVRAAGVAAALAEYRARDDRPSEETLGQEAATLLGTGRLETAQALLELLVAAFPDSPRPHERLSEACERLGDAPAARRHAETALAKLQRAHGLPAARARVLENAAASRLVRLGQGDPKTLRFACGCGGECDRLRYLSGGPCPGCGMEMQTSPEGG
jgi:Flp pilus assembly protein TadD